MTHKNAFLSAPPAATGFASGQNRALVRMQWLISACGSACCRNKWAVYLGRDREESRQQCTLNRVVLSASGSVSVTSASSPGHSAVVRCSPYSGARRCRRPQVHHEGRERRAQMMLWRIRLGHPRQGAPRTSTLFPSFQPVSAFSEAPPSRAAATPRRSPLSNHPSRIRIVVNIQPLVKDRDGERDIQRRCRIGPLIVGRSHGWRRFPASV